MSPRRKEMTMMTPAVRTGGIYIPPFRVAAQLATREVDDKASAECQRLSWDAVKKSVNGLVSAANIRNVAPELLAENLVRGRRVFCQSCVRSQMTSPGFTDVFAALVNTKFPQIGRLLLVRVALQLKRNDQFIAHLANKAVARELVATGASYRTTWDPKR